MDKKLYERGAVAPLFYLTQNRVESEDFEK